MKKSRVLVVDDSASMRQLITVVLNGCPDLDVVGHAADPIEARQAIKDLSPDVVTLDVEMPNMNGLDFLERLMRLRPMPVIMVSSLTQTGGEITTRALEIGAIDCVTKPRPGELRPFGDLADKVRMAAGVRLLAARASSAVAASAGSETVRNGYDPDGRVVAIGSSTGGVEALTAVLSVLPANCAPVVVTQHMPALFTRSFAERLDKLCAATVAEASDGAPLVPGRIYIAPGGSQHLEISAGSTSRGKPQPFRCRLRDAPPVNGHSPSVDVLFRSVARAAGSEAVGVILTGMGRDGAEGLVTMRQAGAATIGQDAATSLIYGMPKVAFEDGGVERQLPLRRIGAEIAAMTNKRDRT